MFIAQEQREPGRWEDVTGEFPRKTRATDIARTLNIASGRKTRVIRVEDIFDAPKNINTRPNRPVFVGDYPQTKPAPAPAPLVSAKTDAKRTARKQTAK